MLAAGQYGATSFAANPRRMDRSVGSLPISCPCKDADIPPDKAVFFNRPSGRSFFVGMWRAIIELAAAKHPQASSFRPYPKILRLCHRRQPYDKPHSVFDVILGLVPRICRRIANSGVADARDRPEHDGGEVFTRCQQRYFSFAFNVASGKQVGASPFFNCQSPSERRVLKPARPSALPTS